MEWSERRVRAIVREAVKKKLALFAAFSDLSGDDLEQEGMTRAMAMHETYRPEKAEYATWITRGVNFCLIDLWRRRSREAKRKDAAIDQAKGKSHEYWDQEDSPPDPGDELAIWLRGVYLAAKTARPAKAGFGRPGHSDALKIAVGSLMLRMKLSSRGALLLLTQRVDLRAAIDKSLPASLPSHAWFNRAATFVTENVKNSQRRRRRAAL